MCRAAIDHFQSGGRAVPGALVVTTGSGEPPSGDIEIVYGNHPVPGNQSFAAAERIASFVERVSHGDDVLVLLSGGTSSLVAAPVRGVSTTDITQLFNNLLGSGADIAATMLLVNQALETWIRERPEQWLWLHNRWPD